MMAEAEERAGEESSQQAEGGSMEKERPRPPQEPQMCPRCDSMNTKFCYYNNYSLSQPRYFCKNCKRYWTKGGALRNVPFGGSYRKGKRQRRSGGSCATTFTNQEGSTPVPSSLDLQQQLQNHFLLDKNRSVLAACGDSGGVQVVHSALYGLGGLEEGGEGYYAPHPTMQTLNHPITASLIDLQPPPTLTYRLPPLHHHAFTFPFQTTTPTPQNHPNRSQFTGVFLPMIAGASSSTTPPYTWHQRPVNPNSSSTTTTIDAPTITTTSGVGASGVWVPPSSLPFV